MARQKMGKTSGKKKKTTAKRSPRRRRMGSASGKIETVALNLAAVGGGIAGIREVSILAGHFFPQLQASPVMTGVTEMVVGGILAWKAKAGWLTYVGLGAGGNGLMTVLNGAGVIGAGPRQMTYQYANRRQMGDPRLQFIAGDGVNGPTTRIGSYPNNFSAVAGVGARKKRYTS